MATKTDTPKVYYAYVDATTPSGKINRWYYSGSTQGRPHIVGSMSAAKKFVNKTNAQKAAFMLVGKMFKDGRSGVLEINLLDAIQYGIG